jgi:glycosyltransferase involved in cell wall biosynthesis
MNTPLVSVILPVYNRAHTLERAILSVQLQGDETPWEIVAVDDGSSDGSAELLESFHDPRIRVLRHPVNLGAGAARNTAIQHARGEYLAFLDSDDEWLRGKLAAQLRELREVGGADLCTTGYELRGSDSTQIVTNADVTDWEGRLHTECTLGNGSTLMLTRFVASRIGPLDTQMPRHEDWDWVLRALEMRFRLRVFPNTLARIHLGATPDAASVARSLTPFLQRHEKGFRKRGQRYRDRVVAKHYENLAAMAYRQRLFALGHASLLHSFRTNPRQSWTRLAALPLGTVDSLLNTRFLSDAMAWSDARWEASRAKQ